MSCQPPGVCQDGFGEGCDGKPEHSCRECGDLTCACADCHCTACPCLSHPWSVNQDTPQVSAQVDSLTCANASC